MWFEGDVDFDFHIAGDFGAEYSFKFPLTVGFDWRPAFRVTDGFKFRIEQLGSHGQVPPCEKGLNLNEVD
jgi:hypothetical protein